MRKLAFLLVVVALLAGCGTDPTERYRPGDLVEAIVSGKQGQVVYSTNSIGKALTCDTPEGPVRQYYIRTAIELPPGKGQSSAKAFALDGLCEFELRPAQTK